MVIPWVYMSFFIIQLNFSCYFLYRAASGKPLGNIYQSGIARVLPKREKILSKMPPSKEFVNKVKFSGWKYGERCLSSQGNRTIIMQMPFEIQLDLAAVVESPSHLLHRAVRTWGLMGNVYSKFLSYGIAKMPYYCLPPHHIYRPSDVSAYMYQERVWRKLKGDDSNTHT